MATKWPKTLWKALLLNNSYNSIHLIQYFYGVQHQTINRQRSCELSISGPDPDQVDMQHLRVKPCIAV